jgi:large conductance mechanosensitive channel
MASSPRKHTDKTVQPADAPTASQAQEAAGDVEDLETILIKDIGKLGKSTLKSLDGFRAFILRGNVVDMAIGIVIGAAFSTVVNALVTDIITPFIPVSSNSSLANWIISIPHTYIKNVQIGLFINSIISFLIVAAIMYFFVVKPVSSFMKLYHKEEVKPATSECPYCYQPINAKATRCPYCTSHIRKSGEHHAADDGDDPVLELPASLEKLSEKLAENIVKKATTSLEASTASEATTAGTASAEGTSSTAPAEK